MEEGDKLIRDEKMTMSTWIWDHNPQMRLPLGKETTFSALEIYTIQVPPS